MLIFFVKKFIIECAFYTYCRTSHAQAVDDTRNNTFAHVCKKHSFLSCFSLFILSL